MEMKSQYRIYKKYDKYYIKKKVKIMNITLSYYLRKYHLIDYGILKVTSFYLSFLMYPIYLYMGLTEKFVNWYMLPTIIIFFFQFIMYNIYDEDFSLKKFRKNWLDNTQDIVRDIVSDKERKRFEKRRIQKEKDEKKKEKQKLRNSKNELISIIRDNGTIVTDKEMEKIKKKEKRKNILKKLK